MLAKRPLLFVSLSFLVGMYILSLFEVADLLIVSVFLVIFFLFALIKTRKIKTLIIVLCCILSFSLGTVRYDISNNVASKELFGLIEKENILLTAEIIEKAKINENSISFIANVISANDGVSTYHTNEKVRFSCYLENDSDYNDIYIPKLGDIVKIRGNVVLPNGPMNTGGFDYSRYLKSDGIFFQTNYDDKDIEKVGFKNRPFLFFCVQFREKCMSFFDETFPQEEAGLLKAYIVGDKSNISEEIENSFSASGLSHILAVSGLHVAVFVSLIVSILKFFKISKRNEMFISAIAAIFFVLFTGASVSALRAGVLCVFAMLAKLIYRKSDPITTLSFAAAMFCLVNPHVIYDASFILSFSATAGILLFYESISKAFFKIYSKIDSKTFCYKFLHNLLDSIAVGLAAQIFILPLLIYIFNGFSLMSVIATVIITPLLTPLLAGGLLFICFSFVSKTLVTPIAGFVFVIAKIVIFIAEKFAKLPFSRILFGEITPILLLLYSLFIAAILSAIKKIKRAYSVFVICFTVLFVLYAINLYVSRDIARVSFINVGQGDCTLIKAPGDCDILIDAGGYTGNESTGEYTIAPYLIKNGVTDIEYVIISHMHSDHIIGLLGVMDKISVDKLIIPYGQIDTHDAKEIIEKAKSKDIDILYFTRGDKLKISDNMEISIVSPDGKQSMYAEDENDIGIVARLDYGETSFLFTGDITENVEKYLVRNYKAELEADVLKVSHHGSKNSSCEEFIDSVNAKYAYIPVGRNYYGHPSKETINRLNTAGITYYRADVNKDVTFYFDDKDIKKVVYQGGLINDLR